MPVWASYLASLRGERERERERERWDQLITPLCVGDGIDTSTEIGFVCTEPFLPPNPETLEGEKKKKKKSKQSCL